MLYVINIQVRRTETNANYVKRETLTETQIVDAIDESDAIQKLNMFYNEKQTEYITYEFTIQSINAVIL